MEILIYGVIGMFIICVAVLLWKYLGIRYSVREIVTELKEKMSTDTNTLISISCTDKRIRSLANEINRELLLLREERLRFREGDAKLKEAVTNISHDLRTPLTAISGYLDLLEEEETSETVSRYLSLIRERTEALTTLTQELFRYTVVTSPDTQLCMETVHVNEVLEVSLAAFYGAFTERGITPDVSIPQEPVIRTLDKTALQRIFHNILNNAVKYSNGDLSVTLQEDGTVVFCNTATEMDRIQAAKLFDRFYTVENARNSTGLGLSIAKYLTEQMGGTIAADYHGQKFYLYLSFEKKELSPVRIDR